VSFPLFPFCVIVEPDRVIALPIISRVSERTAAIATYARVFLIYNPYAGKLIGHGERLLHRTVEILERSGHGVRALPTTGPGAAGSIARQCIDEGADLILAAGGDGTINEVVNGMIHSSVPLGILPGGTANVLAMELGLGTKMERAARMVGQCLPERIAVGLIQNEAYPGGRHFLLMTGAGLDAHIVYHMSAGWKAALGKVAYWTGGFAQLGRRLPEFETRIGERRVRASFALASRVRNYGGDIEIARTVSLLEDRFEVVLFEGKNAFPYLRYLLSVLTHRLDRTRGVHVLQATELQMEEGAERIYVQVDGEFAGWLPAQLKIVPDSLTILTPPGFRANFHTSSSEQSQWTTSPTR
jgi:YegS/Rv2252/BmrU family lipid kinase